MNRVWAQMFHMVPIDSNGQSQKDPEDPQTYGYEVHDEAAEFSDYGMTLAEVQAHFTPQTILALLSERDRDLAEWAARHGIYLNGDWYDAAALEGREALGLPAPDSGEEVSA